MNDSHLTVTPATNINPRSRDLLALGLLVPVPSIGVWLALDLIPGTVGQAAFALCKIWLLLLPAVWVCAVEGQPMPGFRRGFRFQVDPAPRRRLDRSGLGWGAAVGLITMTLICLGYFAFGSHLLPAAPIRQAAARSGLDVHGVYILMSIWWCLGNSLLEEYVWRWFVQDRLARLLPTLPAVLLAAGCFSMHHLIALKLQTGWTMTLLGTLGVFIGGCLWSGLRAKFHSIWPGYVAHVLADLPIFIIGHHLIFG